MASVRRGRGLQQTQFGETFLGKGQIYTCLCVSERQRWGVRSNLQQEARQENQTHLFNAHH